MSVTILTQTQIEDLLADFPAYVQQQVANPETATTIAGMCDISEQCPVHHYLEAKTGHDFSVDYQRIIDLDSSTRYGLPVPTEQIVRAIDHFDYDQDGKTMHTRRKVTWQEVAKVLDSIVH